MGMQKNYVDTNFTEGPTLGIDETEVSTFTTDTPHKNKRLNDMLTKHQDTISQEELEYLTKTGIPSQGGRGGK